MALRRAVATLFWGFWWWWRDANWLAVARFGDDYHITHQQHHKERDATLLVGRTMAPTTPQQQRHATFASRRRQQPAPYVGTSHPYGWTTQVVSLKAPRGIRIRSPVLRQYG